MKLELISFRICPFVQRAVITLRHKNVPFELVYIDLSDPPAWFLEISPFRKVPVLRVDDTHVIFESSVIDEFLDEITPGSLLPADPLQRALDRSWIEFGTACQMDFSRMVHANTQAAFESARTALREKMGSLEKVLQGGPWFNGPDLSLVDFGYAPLFLRCRELGLEGELCSVSESPRTAAWADAILEMPVVRESVPADFPQLLRNRIRSKAPYAANALGI